MTSNLLTATTVSLFLIASGWRAGATASDGSQKIKITRSGSQPSQQAPVEHFTGSVRVLFQATDPSHVSGACVTFVPGARSAWYTHPVGQTLIVTAGTGWIQRWGDPVEEIRQGDVVWIPAGQKHWHGASPNSAMTHIAIQEARDGKNVDWMEKVSDEQYGQGPSISQTKKDMNKEPSAIKKPSTTSRPNWCSSPTTSSSATSGSVQTSRSVTAV